MSHRIAILLLIGASLSAADFQAGQAARAVIGQSSFSSQDQGIAATSLVISKNRLYASDASNHVFTFDLTSIPDMRDDFKDRATSGCSVCGFPAVAVASQAVMPGVAAVGGWGKMVAIADAANHRVLIWRDTSLPRLNGNPDVVLGRFNEHSSIGPATLIDPVSVALDGKHVYVGDAALHRILIWNSIPMTDEQPPDAVLGQPDFVSSGASDFPRPDSIQFPAALASDGTNLFVADSADRRILVFSPADTRLGDNAVLNSASLLRSPLAPGTLITVSGAGLSDASAAAESGTAAPLPRKLSGTEVVFDGQALPLLAVSPQQVQAQLPYDLGGRSAGSLYIRTEHTNGSVTIAGPTAVAVAPSAPGLFAFGGEEPREGVLLHVNAGVVAQSGAPVTAENPAKPGEILTIWATGLGAIAENGSSAGTTAGLPYPGPAAPALKPVQAYIDGQAAEVLSAKLPEGAIGVYEIQIVVPEDLAENSKAQLFVTQNGQVSNTVTFALQPGP